ncbi:MAG: lactate utilization protein B [Thermoprotei archaeon]|nr:lactate utilization protein B [Thermoprotei archaeon]
MVLDEISKALDNIEFQEALRRASTNNQVKVAQLLTEKPELIELAKEVGSLKRRSVESLRELVEKAVESLRKIAAKPYYAETVEEARKLIGDIVGSGKRVVMAKSMAATEIGLRQYLESLNNEVWETDLGEFLIQLEGSKPMHAIAPAVHMTRERASTLVAEKLKVGIPKGGVEDIVSTVRMFLRDKIVTADVGVSGANALAADTGAIVLVENESNIRLVTSAPPTHIAIVPIDKIVPTLIEAFKVAIVQATYAGLYPPTYINIIAGPSSTADIEQIRVYGAQGPRELHVILLDNGRMKASKDPVLKEQLYCIRCGRCQFECPVWIHTANTWGGPTYGGPMGIVWTAITLDPIEAGKLAYLCLGCGRCDEACPVNINISMELRHLKMLVVQASKRG